ncbi:hypothetical protein R1flu_008217 [Riccia fluitans]|uniref:Uncharacterized protein n=1 Tax=Riccia fluitans TaxID=41844 RepID=A0ABD1YEL5_9MARC
MLSTAAADVEEISTSSKTVYRDLNDRCPSLLCQSLASSALSTSVFERVVELHISFSKMILLLHHQTIHAVAAPQHEEILAMAC